MPDADHAYMEWVTTYSAPTYQEVPAKLEQLIEDVGNKVTYGGEPVLACTSGHLSRCGQSTSCFICVLCALRHRRKTLIKGDTPSCSLRMVAALQCFKTPSLTLPLWIRQPLSTGSPRPDISSQTHDGANTASSRSDHSMQPTENLGFRRELARRAY